MLSYGIVIGLLVLGLAGVAIWKRPSTIYKNDKRKQNPMEGKKVRFVENPKDKKNADGVRGHLEAVGDSKRRRSWYDRFWKRGIDIVCSLCGLIILSPVFLLFSVAILIDDPGPVFFTQKRIGRNKQYFMLHKFRTMKMTTPHDVPTHMLKDPEQYITRVGRFLRKSSLDELPQIADIFIGNMSIIGPRPALWNQDVLVAERDRYGANDFRPGLTGWAQINGRDELEISEKAKLDGVYCMILKMGGWKAFMMDLRCIFGTVFSVLRREGVVEGGTGTLKKPMRPNDGKTLFEEDEYQIKK